MIPAFENSVLWHERDLAHSSVERVIIPDSTTLLYYILKLAIGVVKNMEVHEDQMMANVEKKNIGFGILSAFDADCSGQGCAERYGVSMGTIQCTAAWDTKTPFKELVKQDEKYYEIYHRRRTGRYF